MAEKHLIVPTPSGSTPCASPCHTPYFQEEQEEYGAAAVMRMTLGSQKVGLAPLPSQVDLYNYAIAQNRPGEPMGLWYIDPQGLRDTLRDHRPPGFTNTFNIYGFPNTTAGRQQAHQKIIDTIDAFEVAPAALVQGGSQWVAVVGYRTNDGTGDLEAVFLNDPRPPVSDGTGDPPDHEVDASLWDSHSYYFQVISAPGSFWHEQLVLVVDPKPPEGESRVARQSPLAEGRQIISPSQAVEFVHKHLEGRGMLRRKLFARAVEAGQVAEPQLVQTRHREDQFYYLTRFQINEGDAAVVALDARSGIFLEAIAYHKPVRFFGVAPKEIPRLLEKGFTIYERTEDVRNRIVGQLHHYLNPERCGLAPEVVTQRLHHILDLELARLRQPLLHRQFRPEEINVHSTMVWQPSAQSMSPLYPAYLVSTPRQNLYVRAADGLVFDGWMRPWWQRLGG